MILLTVQLHNALDTRYTIPTVAVEELQSVLDAVAGPQAVHLLLLLDEGDEGSPLHLHRLPGPGSSQHA